MIVFVTLFYKNKNLTGSKSWSVSELTVVTVVGGAEATIYSRLCLFVLLVKY